jgi:hypothetical protein
MYHSDVANRTRLESQRKLLDNPFNVARTNVHKSKGRGGRRRCTVGYRQPFPKTRIEKSEPKTHAYEMHAHALMDVPLTGVYLTRRTSHKRTSHKRASHKRASYMGRASHAAGGCHRYDYRSDLQDGFGNFEEGLDLPCVIATREVIE